MPSEFSVTRRVEFAETDMAGIMHFSNYYRYMEAAEHAFFRSLGYSIVTEKSGHDVGWPRVHASCDYKRPLRFEDEVEIRLIVREKKSKTLTYEFVFTRVDGDASEEVARGKMIVACVTRDGEGRMKAVPIPEPVAAKIDVAPAH